MTHPARFIPTLEPLESRLTPALTIRQVGTSLRITGDDRLNDFIQIADTGGSVDRSITVVANGQFRYSSGPITNIRVRTGLGNDVVQYTLQRPLLSGNSRRINIDTGGGQDNVTINLASNLQTNTALSLKVRLGAGYDTFLMNAGAAGVAAGASLLVDVDCGSGNDTSTINYAGRVDGVVRIRNNGGADFDRVEVNGGPGTGSTGFMSVRLFGGQGSDVLTPNVQKTSVFDSVLLDLLADGGPDFDICVLAQGQGFRAINCESTPRR